MFFKCLKQRATKLIFVYLMEFKELTAVEVGKQITWKIILK